MSGLLGHSSFPPLAEYLSRYSCWTCTITFLQRISCGGMFLAFPLQVPFSALFLVVFDSCYPGNQRTFSLAALCFPAFTYRPTTKQLLCFSPAVYAYISLCSFSLSFGSLDHVPFQWNWLDTLISQIKHHS